MGVNRHVHYGMLVGDMSVHPGHRENLLKPSRLWGPWRASVTWEHQTAGVSSTAT